MRLKVIMATANQEFYEELLQSRLGLATDEIEVFPVRAAHGVASLESAYDEIWAAPYVLEEAMKAEEEKFDGIVLDCAADPGLRGIREKLNIPVVGAGEASYLTAMLLCSRFSIIAAIRHSVLLIDENVRKYGLKERVASIRSADVPVLSLRNHDIAVKAICETGKRAISEDGAQSIVLGCTGMQELRDRIEQNLGIPVVEPVTSGVQMAAALVRMKLKTSKEAYPYPTEKAFI